MTPDGVRRDAPAASGTLDQLIAEDRFPGTEYKIRVVQSLLGDDAAGVGSIVRTSAGLADRTDRASENVWRFAPAFLEALPLSRD